MSSLKPCVKTTGIAMAKPLALSIVIPVFNAALPLEKILAALQCQAFHQYAVEIIIVDDGSSVPVEIDPLYRSAYNITVVRTAANQGRANARNNGAQIASGDYILFLDADCIPEKNFIERVMEHVQRKDSMVFGHIIFYSDPFFEYFENKVQKKRSESLDRWYLNMTTACVLMFRDIFEAVGGYSSRFTKYGMEDRDLLVRIYEKFPALDVQYSFGMAVAHKGEVSTNQYIDKFRECGKYSIPVFREQHPMMYKQMNYALVDYVYNPWLRCLPKPVVKFITGLCLSVLMSYCHRFTSYRLRAWGLKMLKGFALLQGTISSTD